MTAPDPGRPRRADPFTRLGASRVGVWIIGHVVSPLHRWLLALTRGRAGAGGDRRVLLLTTLGRRSGRARSVPLFYVREGNALVVCNVRPSGERPNPWPMNVRAHPRVEIRAAGVIEHRVARAATGEEVARVWPKLVAIWPAYDEFFARSGERSIFMLEPETG